MASKPRQLRQTKQVLTVVAIITVVLGLIPLLILGYKVDWTGFNTQHLQSAKTLWDWMQLLIIPIVLTAGGFFYNRLRNQADRDKISDSQREVVLQSYFDRISGLLLNKSLLVPGSESAQEARDVARIWTLTVLHRLDADRKGALIQFLYDSGLISEWGGSFSIIDLSGADLSEINLPAANLSTANLSKVNLSGANLSKANLWRVNLSEANLNEADLSGADLHEAYLSWNYRRKAKPRKPDLRGASLRKTNLRKANLSRADLSEANLQEAVLDGANLRGTLVTAEQLEEARSCRHIIH